MGAEPDYYAILEVASDAGEDEIRLAFRRLARRYHPDVVGTGDVAHMQRLNAAYQTLSDPERRRTYDRERGILGDSNRPAAGSAITRRPPSHRVGALRHSAGPLGHVATLAAGDGASVTALAFARDGLLVGTGLIDGRVLLWELPSGRLLNTLTFAPKATAGVLQELRLSPSGALAAAWGLLLGMRVWRVAEARALWTAGVNGPSGSMDAALGDIPPRLRLALPDAPLALADTDPFRWAHQGRTGTAVYLRPLSGPVAPVWAVPRHCSEESGTRRPRNLPGGGARVYQRLLSADGQRLLTLVATPAGKSPTGGALHVWEVEHRPMLGRTRPRRVARATIPTGSEWFPLAATPDLAWIATGHTGRAMGLVSPRSHERRAIPTGAVPADARAVLSADGALLALARGARLDMWRTADGGHAQEWEFAAEIAALEFARQGSRPLLAIGLGNGVAEVWG
jgi:hypothetical protein